MCSISLKNIEICKSLYFNSQLNERNKGMYKNVVLN